MRFPVAVTRHDEAKERLVNRNLAASGMARDQQRGQVSDCLLEVHSYQMEEPGAIVSVTT